MAQYILKRSVQSLILLFVIMSAVFVGGRQIGDPASLMLGGQATEEQVRQLRRSLGLEAPLWEQYVGFLTNIIRGDFGESMRYGYAHTMTTGPEAQGQAVLPLVLERLPATLSLAFLAILLAVAIAVPLGCFAAMRPGSAIDRAVTVVSLAGVSLVQFWLGLMLILIFAVQLGWLPTSGYGSGGLAYAILPALTLAARPIGRLAQIVRSSMLDELSKPYIAAARAKGASEMRLVFGHGLKNAAIPIMTMLGDELANVMTGAIVVEVVFGWPGIGALVVSALSIRDLPLIEASIFVIAIMVILINLAVDLSYKYLNPKVRLHA
ncbi:peptide/nickel transport system permease protein [Spinactinospora alkalitolerans]|uniref:Peptide/nickel transport system permease protein n=1 Tax=Spinactinospora alkalitolerans TaxID=687207 RepID=A0A852TVC9_9ACTN|nr:ABC transporter permease [Spinactinospora alkalitolerans]NYE47979.1 peptide/nickel transport system permease protein [Spinactinospora alkalitolerans]